MKSVAERYQIRGARSTEIAGSLESAIVHGRFDAQAQLPTVRALAEALGVSVVTVANAYRELGRRGLVVADGRNGTRVRSQTAVLGRQQRQFPTGTRNLADGNPDPGLLPSLLPAALPKRSSLYGSAPEEASLVRTAVARFQSDGIAAEAESLAVASGALDALTLLLASAGLRLGDRIAVEDPSYCGHLDLLRSLGFTPLPVAADAYGMQPSALETALCRGARAIVIVPRAMNPSGTALDAARARKLRALLDERAAVIPDGLLVIEDDFCDGIAGVPAVTVWGERSRAGRRWAVVRSVAKSLGPDLRLAVVTGDRVTINRLKKNQRVGVGWVSHVLQTQVAALWSDVKTMRMVANAERVYTQRRDALLAALRERLGIETLCRAGINLWIPVLDERETSEALIAAGYGVAEGERFRLDTAPAIRVTFARLREEEVAPFVAALEVALQRRPPSVRLA